MPKNQLFWLQTKAYIIGFLAVGLVWGLLDADPIFSRQIKIFFLSCVVVAGAFGGLTVNKKIFFIQSLPALLGLISVVI